MKITTTYLRQVIKEELAQTLNEWNENGPVRLKVPDRRLPKGQADYGEKGGIDDLTREHTRQIDDEIDTMINNTKNAEDAIKTIDKYSKVSSLMVPHALGLYVIAKKFRYVSPTSYEETGVYKHFKDKIEGGPDRWRAGDYLTIGGGSVNMDKFKELFPKLMSHMGLLNSRPDEIQSN